MHCRDQHNQHLVYEGEEKRGNARLSSDALDISRPEETPVNTSNVSEAVDDCNCDRALLRWVVSYTGYTNLIRG